MKKQSWFKKHEKAAVAAACAAVLGVTGITAFQLQSVHAMTYSVEKGSRDTGIQVTKKERQEMRERIEEKIRELEKYDVTYDSREDAIYYDGRKVLCIVDQLRNGTNTEDYIYCADGDITLYTERNADGVLTGVRVDSGEDNRFRGDFFDDDYIYRGKDDEIFFGFDDEEEWEEETEYLKDKYGNLFMFSFSTAVDEVTVLDQGTGDVCIERDAPFGTTVISDYDIAAEAAEAIGETIESEELDSAMEDLGRDVTAKSARAAETIAEEGRCSSAYMDENNVMYMDDNYDLFESLGLKWNKDKGYWTYNDEKVKVIWVEDGSFTSYGNLSDGVYLYVRKDSGNGKVSFQVEELTRSEMQELSQQNHPGNSIP
ncbi:hypothetical protein NXH76_05150 [Blautia schinkii]|nr:hypothetical protein [Blautia schinkii]